MKWPSFHPRLLDIRTGYNSGRLMADVSAGITVGVVALPLAMAFAIASGLKPEAGLFTAIVAGFLISALGGSAVQIGGPAGAFIVIVYGIVERYGVANLLLCTMFAGVLLFVMGVLRAGNLVRLIPVSIVIGFTNGIAVLIALSQVKDFFGLKVENVPADFFARLQVFWQEAHTFDPWTVVVSVVCLAIVVFWPKTYVESRYLPIRVMSRVPGTIVALVASALAVSALNLDVATIGSRFGGIPSALPSFAFPAFEWATVKLFHRCARAGHAGARRRARAATARSELDGHRSHRRETELLQWPHVVRVHRTGRVARDTCYLSMGIERNPAGPAVGLRISRCESGHAIYRR